MRVFAKQHTVFECPRFAFINLIEPHIPYIPPADLYDRFLPGIAREEAFGVTRRMLPDGSATPAWTKREKEIVGKL